MKLLYLKICAITFACFCLRASPAIEDDVVNIADEIQRLESKKKSVDIVEVSTFTDVNYIVVDVILENHSDDKIIYDALLRLSQGRPSHCAKNVKISSNAREWLLKNENVDEVCYRILLNNKLKNKHYLVVNIPRSILESTPCFDGKLHISIPYYKIGDEAGNAWAVSKEIQVDIGRKKDKNHPQANQSTGDATMPE